MSPQDDQIGRLLSRLFDDRAAHVSVSDTQPSLHIYRANRSRVIPAF